GNLAEAQKDAAAIENIKQQRAKHKMGYDNDWVDMLNQEASAWVLHGQGKDDDAIALLRKVADHEDSVGEEQTSMPAREMLADMLLELKRPADALAEYRGDLKFNPKRFNGLYGAARASEMAGQQKQAAEYYALLVKTCEGGTSDRPELKKARETVVAAN